MTVMIMLSVFGTKGLQVSADGNIDVVENYDIVFVLDDSGSMKKTDPDKLVLQSVKSFLDQRPDNGDQLGVVTYSLDAENSYNLHEMRNEADRAEIKDFVDTHIFRKGKYTNIGAGIQGAVDQINTSGENSHKKAIILISDGQNDVKGSGVSADEASQMLTDALSAANEAGYPVYAIGINPKTDEYEQTINDISSTTGGVSYFPKSVEEMNSVMNSILNELAGSEASGEDGTVVDLSDQPVQITQTLDENVFEADIKIEHQGDLTYTIYKPDGTAAVDGTDYKVVTDSGYTIMKLIQPEAGDWVLEIASSLEEKARFDTLIYYYNLEVRFDEGLADSAEVGETVSISAKLYYADDSSVIDNLTDYSDVSASIVIDGSETRDMTISADGMSIDTSFDTPGEYSIAIVMNISGYELQTKSDSSYTLTVAEAQAATQATTQSTTQSATRSSASSKSSSPNYGALLIIPVVIAAALGVIGLIRSKTKRVKGCDGMTFIVNTVDGGTERLGCIPPSGTKNNVYKLVLENFERDTQPTDRTRRILQELNENASTKEVLKGESFVIKKDKKKKTERYAVKMNSRMLICENGDEVELYESSSVNVQPDYITSICVIFSYQGGFDDEF